MKQAIWPTTSIIINPSLINPVYKLMAGNLSDLTTHLNFFEMLPETR